MSQIAPIQISMVVTVLLLIALFEALDYYFFRQLFHRKQRPKPFVIAHWTLNILTVGGVFAILFLFSNQTNPTNQQWISHIFTLLLAQIWGKLLFLIGSFPRLWIKREKLKRQFLFVGIFLLAATWVGMGNAVWNSFHPKLRTVEIEIDQLPDAFDGYSIAFLSDLHLGIFNTSGNAIDQAVKITNQLNLDLILFGGDLVSLSSKEALPFIDRLSSLQAKDAKLAVRGNHDYGIYDRTNPNLPQERIQFTKINQEMGIELLDNQCKTIARGLDTLFIIGTEYYNPQRDFPDGLSNALPSNYSNHTSILLTHNPQHFDESVLGKTEIDLTLSGHTHAMQFVVSLFGKRFSPSALLFNHWGGLYQYDSQNLYVNEGLGASLYAIRWGTQSEITHIILKQRAK